MLSVETIVGGGLLFAVGLAALLLLRRRSGSAKRQTTTGIPPRSTQYTDRFDSAELVRRLEVPLETLQNWTPHYQQVTIAKKNGQPRELLVPNDETRSLQRTILKRLLARLNAHPLACGFEEHTSIVDAAIPHVCRAVVVKIDVQDFFASTRADRVRLYLERIGWDSESAQILTSLTTTDGGLPMGAPTSPRLSNLVNAPLDEALLKLVKKYSGGYTRYADDLTFSFDVDNGRQIRSFIRKVRLILDRHGYRMHTGKKLQILRRHQQQRVLGLVVNHRVALPRKTRRWLRAVRHRMQNGGRATLSETQLAGWTAYEQMIERQREE